MRAEGRGLRAGKLCHPCVLAQGGAASGVAGDNDTAGVVDNAAKRRGVD